MKSAALTLAACLALSGSQAADTARKNVLMIAIDDLRPQLSCVSMPGAVRPKQGMHTPNMCALAAKSLVLERSQVVMATCSPSRTGLLTGRHPSATHVWDLFSYFRNVTGNFTTIPQFFKERGYNTQGMGKIFHPGAASGGNKNHCEVCAGSDDANYSWSLPYFHCDNPVRQPGVNPDNDAWKAVPKNVTDKYPLCDSQTLQFAKTAFKALEKDYLETGTNFFQAVGFHKPHLPFVFPERFEQYYAPESIQVPPNQFAPWDMPQVAWQNYGETRSYTDIAALNASGAPNTTLPEDEVKKLRRAYYSAVSYTDYNIGEVLAMLDNSSVANSTIVLLWGDHGWHLGEHGLWDKHTNFDLNTHAPAMLHVPGVTDNGMTTTAFTSTTDFFPTLADLAMGETVPTCPRKFDTGDVLLCTEGKSLRPLLEDPKSTNFSVAAFSTYNRGFQQPGVGSTGTPPTMSSCIHHKCTMGYTMVTRIDGHEIRYTEWVEFFGDTQPEFAHYAPAWDKLVAAELYNHTDDAFENHNIYADKKGSPEQQELQKRLHAGWQLNHAPQLA